MKFKISTTAACLAMMALCVAASSTAFATTIGFSCSNGSGKTTGNAAICPDAGNITEPLVSWTQGQYTITPASSTAWYYNANQGNPAPGLSNVSGGSKITITDGGGIFNFVSVDVKGTGLTGYNIIGYDGVTGVLDISCSSSCGGTSNWETILAGLKSDVDLTSLAITLDGSGALGLDNIDVVTPEPNGLLLLGTGILAAALFARRKLTA